jgi:hypothetical protein
MFVHLLSNKLARLTVSAAFLLPAVPPQVRGQQISHARFRPLCSDVQLLAYYLAPAEANGPKVEGPSGTRGAWPLLAGSDWDRVHVICSSQKISRWMLLVLLRRDQDNLAKVRKPH